MAAQLLPIRQGDADPLRAVVVALRRRRLARRAAMAWPRPLQIALDPVSIAKSLPRRLSDSHSLRAVAAALRRETKRAVVRRGASQSCMSAGWCWALRSKRCGAGQALGERLLWVAAVRKRAMRCQQSLASLLWAKNSERFSIFPA